jgi:DNA helicase HerA-like ATPase
MIMAIGDVQEVFVSNRTARLMRLEESEQTRYQYEVWFEYTRQTMTELREGTLLAVRNFASDNNSSHYSVLEVVSIMPIHYALGEKPEGYPGFVMEAARNIATDWTAQENRSDEDTTIIRCVAIPTGIEMMESTEGRRLGADQALPMIGSDVSVLTTGATAEIVNKEINAEEDHVFEGGRWLVNAEVPIHVRADDLVRTHFGIFGFTGAGKSNLLSTYAERILRASSTRDQGTKLVMFDLMSEYTVLLLDQLLTQDHACLLVIGEATLPGSVIEFMSGQRTRRSDAINHLVSSTLYPRALERHRAQFAEPFGRLLDQRRIRIYRPPAKLFREFLDENERILTGGNLGNSRNAIFGLRDQLRNSYGGQTLSPATATTVINDLQQFQQQQGSLVSTALNNLATLRRMLEEVQGQQEHVFPREVSLSLQEIIEVLNDRNSTSLVVVQAHNPDDLRDFAFELGRELFEHRRRRGIIQPLVSFVFDEADEFIPQQYERDSSYSRSAWIAETLARRGRKFGLGLGICTQRVAHLKTNVMAQPHTYLISKLPRVYDREAIQAAFGFSEDMFRQTFKFAPGDWLIASHDATGLKGVPIPIHTANANDRIQRFINGNLPEVRR